MLLQRLIVALLVIAAASFSAWRLLPLRRRLWLIERITPRASRGDGILGWLWRSTQAQSGKGCNTCAGRTASAGEHPTRTSAGLRR